jgi:XRE family transcriptional regulator, master regulator for biofilm formation
MTPKRLDQVMRELRENKGLTQEELAFKARVTPGYVAQLELGLRKNPSLDVVRRLARALKIPLAELLA